VQTHQGAGYEDRVLKSKMLNQVQTNVADSENGGPWTDNVVFAAISGSLTLSAQRSFDCRSRAESSRDDNVRRLCDSIVGANGCSPETALRLTSQEIQ